MKDPFIRIEVKNSLRIVYFRADGSGAVFIGGKRTWRNQNPGNIGYGNGKLAKELGAIGKAGGFAVFPDRETGELAIFLVLGKPDFQGRTLAEAIQAWAPSEDNNDTELYKRQVHTWTGLDPNRKIKSLSKSELESFVKAIERKEGWKEGKVVEFQVPKTKKQITSVRKNKKGTIIAYFVDKIGWISKADGVSLARRGQIEAVVATSRRGHLFLRTPPGTPVEKQLEHLG